MDLSAEYYKQLPKADLHVHLNGAVPTTEIQKLLLEQEVLLPADFSIEEDLQILTPVKSLREYFKPWTAFKKLPIGKQNLQRMVSAAISKLALDNIRYVEFRNSPFYISEINSISIKESLSWLIDCIKLNGKIYGVDTKLILSLTRHELDLKQAWELLEAIEEVNHEQIIVGLDLSGDEDFPIPLKDVSYFFRYVKKENNLNITIHAGETGDISNIIWAVEECGADRIGHGLAAAGSEYVLEMLKDNEICLEVSLVSNLRTGYCKQLEYHPINKFIEYGVPFVLCTDNPSVHNVSLSEEYELFYKIFKRLDVIQGMYDTQKKFSFGRDI